MSNLVIFTKHLGPGVSPMAHPPRLLNVILMIILSHIKLLRHLHLCGNWFVELLLLFTNKLLSGLQLLLIHSPYPAPILRAIVWALSVHLGRVVHHKETLQKLPESNEIRVVYNSNCLSMHGIALTYLAIRGVICPSLLIA